MTDRPAILFVCLGNICRSPLAEGALRDAAARRGAEVFVDSAGTGSWHAGEPPDPRARAVASSHGVDIGSLRARQVRVEDFDCFTHVVALDLENLASLRALRPEGSAAALSLLLDHVPGRTGEAVADPYFGDEAGFDQTWADVTEGAEALLDAILAGRVSGLPEAAAALLGEEVRWSERLHGGGLSEVVRLHLVSGEAAVVKSGPGARTKAAMLVAIGRAEVPAPRVLAVGDGVLVMQDLGRDTGPGGAWNDLGRVLRRLHFATGEGYGWSEDYAFGPVAIPNTPAPTWPEFWGERRLLAGIGEVPVDLGRRVERLCLRLVDLLPRRPRPALLHGDLWPGNVMADGARVTGLIDPACYHGHAEVDLAMLTLFGAPGPAFVTEYGEVESGVDARRPIYQLWPALVHLRLFGGGYRGMVESRLAAVE